MVSDEMLIKFRNSWFFAKSILVEYLKNFWFKVELYSIKDGIFTDFIKTPNIDFYKVKMILIKQTANAKICVSRRKQPRLKVKVFKNN